MPTTTKGRLLRQELNDTYAKAHAHNGAPDHYLPISVDAECSLLMRRATSYARMQEAACCYECANGDKWDAKESRLESLITELAKSLKGVKGVKFTGDPRGYTVRLILDCGRGNTWGGDDDGWGIA